MAKKRIRVDAQTPKNPAAVQEVEEATREGHILDVYGETPAQNLIELLKGPSGRGVEITAGVGQMINMLSSNGIQARHRS